jgi:hypothetical protein
VFHKKQKEEKEDAKAPYQNSVLDEGRRVQSPCVGHEIMARTADDDHEALVPHSDVDQQGYGEKPGNAPAHFSEKEEQGDYRVADHHDPELKAVVTEGSPSEGLLLHDVVAVPGEKVFHNIGVSHDRPEDNIKTLSRTSSVITLRNERSCAAG